MTFFVCVNLYIDILSKRYYHKDNNIGRKKKEVVIMRKKSEMQKANEEFVKTYDDSKYPKPSVTADIVIFGMFDKEEDNYRKIAEKELKVLLIQRGAAPYEGCYALPGGFVGPKETIGEAAERELKEETNCNCNFLEQFGTYSNPNRDPRRWVISNGFMALVNAGQEVIQAGDDASDAKWFDVSFQEEDGVWNLCLIHGDEKLHARLEETTSKWDVKKKFKTIESDDLAFDHELILADAIVQLRKWITETHIAFRLLPEQFTLRELQQIHETVLDTKLLVPAFRRKVADLVEDTGEMTGDAGHRPAAAGIRRGTLRHSGGHSQRAEPAGRRLLRAHGLGESQRPPCPGGRGQPALYGKTEINKTDRFSGPFFP